MDILSGRDDLKLFHQDFADATEREAASMSPEEFRDSIRVTVHQAAFAQHFAEHAPDAWADLVFLKPLAVSWLVHRFEILTGTGSLEATIEVAKDDRLLNIGIKAWMTKYGIGTPWVQAMALVTLRAFAYAAALQSSEPTTLLHNRFPTLMIENGMVELGTSTFTSTPRSSGVVCADLGVQEWNTLQESKAQFRKRMIEAFTRKLNEQLDAVSSLPLAEDQDIKWHWIDMTIERYAAHQPIRRIAGIHQVSRPAVDKAVEAVRQVLGFEKLPETWGATKSKPW